MNPYGMTIIAQGREIEIPVLPPKLKVTSSGNNDKATVLELGDILILRKKGLRSITWDSFFPVNDAPFVTGRLSAPLDIVQAIQAARDTLEPVRLLITGTDLDINVRMGVETFDYEERSGELGDFYYSIKLTEWKDYSPRRVVLPPAPAQPAKTQEPERPGKPETPEKTQKTYTVKKGDCLWNIAKAMYGKGSDYTKIYNANKGVIGKNPNLIYPGQVFVIP